MLKKYIACRIISKHQPYSNKHNYVCPKVHALLKFMLITSCTAVSVEGTLSILRLLKWFCITRCIMWCKSELWKISTRILVQ